MKFIITPPGEKLSDKFASDRDQFNQTRIIEALIDFDTGHFHCIRQSGRTSRNTK